MARRADAVVMGVVTAPFHFEQAARRARRRRHRGDAGIVDVLVVVENDRLLEILPGGTAMEDARCDEVLLERSAASRPTRLAGARKSIAGRNSDPRTHCRALITPPALTSSQMINVDFADVRSVMADAGMGVVTIGRASGADRAIQAAEAALASPLLDIELRAVTGAPPPPPRRASSSAHLGAHSGARLFGRPHPLPRPPPSRRPRLFGGGRPVDVSAGGVGRRADSRRHRRPRRLAADLRASVTADLSDEIVVTLVATGFAPPPPRAGDDDGMRSSGRPQLDSSLDLFDYRPPSTSVLDGREATTSMARSGGTPTTWTAASGGRNDGATATLSHAQSRMLKRE